MRWRAQTIGQQSTRRRAGRPQLKREPLGIADFMFPPLTPTTAPALALELGGLALAADGLRLLIPAWRSTHWESVSGRIVASQPVSGPGSVPWGRGTALVWDPGVVYEYVVDGAKYHSQRVSFRGHWQPQQARCALHAGIRLVTRSRYGTIQLITNVLSSCQVPVSRTMCRLRQDLSSLGSG